MDELEVKILEIDKAAVIKQLEAWGAEKTFEGLIDAVVYDHSNQLKKRNALLRLRRKGDKAYLTFKVRKPDQDVKVCIEHETEVDFAVMQAILAALNFKPKDNYTKTRISYRIDPVQFDIDEYPGLPVFMEIEAPTKALIEEYVQKFGFPQERVKAWGGLELLNHYGAR